MEIPKSYNVDEVEKKWQDKWDEWGIHEFNRQDDDTPTYVIDTPPPYPSGEFHIGNALNWIYFDFVARYKRMQGFNVLFPQGWDCHGLPTEVQVEKEHGIRKGDVPREKFRELCVELTGENIRHMKKEMNSLGLSIDWTTEYRTMDPEYYGKTQLSFLELYEDDLIYQGKHPVNWCPRCETAIADAEVEYEERGGTLNYIQFEVEGEDDYLTIATTRPELLPACVLAAVHPDDERYGEYVGKELVVPIFGQTVEVVADREVDREFGTGVVMICTYGDKADVQWKNRYDLPVIRAINERGELTEAAGEYSGLTVEEGKEEMIEDLRERGRLEEQESLEQSVGVCWRCETPIEILTKDQWFMNVLDLNDEVVREAEDIRWVPEHMRLRLQEWARSMDWDWVISRQRIFATPIPVWFCSACGNPVLAEREQLPVKPLQEDPPVQNCPECGASEFEPEEDVLDTWMDSSITIAVHAGWPDMDPRLFPADLQSNGTDIIRTWDYYLLVRHLALFGEAPYKTVLINGMVFGPDGRKMSKSQGNYVETTRARDEHGADALRQWAAMGATPGSDVPFTWKEVDFGYKFQRKFWNAARFAAPHIEDVDPDWGHEELEMRPPDRWILSRLNQVVEEATRYLENFKFQQALKAVRTFVWHEFCDMYIEEVKHRLYQEEPTSDAARYSLYQVLWTVDRLLAPFIPHFAEEIYQLYFSSDQSPISVHRADWPEPEKDLIDEEWEEVGLILNSILSEVRQFKSSRDMPLNEEISSVEAYAPSGQHREALRGIKKDVEGAGRVSEFKIGKDKPDLEEEVVSVEPRMSSIGPKFRDDAKLVAQAISELDPEELEGRVGEGFTILVDGREFELSEEDVKVSRGTVSSGREVEVRDVPDFGITLIISA